MEKRGTRCRVFDLKEIVELAFNDGLYNYLSYYMI